MAQTILIRRTSPRDVDECGLNGQPVRYYWPQIRRHLRNAPDNLGAVILAEPVADRNTGDIDWYIETDREVHRYSDLDDPGKRSVAIKMGRILRWIEKECERLGASDEANDRLLGDVLASAFEVPSLDVLHSTGDQPVLACWGALAPGSRPEKNILSRTFLASAPVYRRLEESLPMLISLPSEAAIPEELVDPRHYRNRSHFSWALLIGSFALLLATIFAAYQSCGLRIPWLNVILVDGCNAGDSRAELIALERSLNEERALRDVLAGAQAELAELETECRVEPRDHSSSLPKVSSQKAIACGGKATESGGEGHERYSMLLGSQPGTVQISYCMELIPDRLNVLYQGEIVATTGGSVKGADTLEFDYAPIDNDYELIIEMIADNNGTEWKFQVSCPNETAPAFAC